MAETFPGKTAVRIAARADLKVFFAQSTLPPVFPERQGDQSQLRFQWTVAYMHHPDGKIVAQTLEAAAPIEGLGPVGDMAYLVTHGDANIEQAAIASFWHALPESAFSIFFNVLGSAGFLPSGIDHERAKWALQRIFAGCPADCPPATRQSFESLAKEHFGPSVLKGLSGKPQAAAQPRVKYKETMRKETLGQPTTYEVYTAASKEDALAFLEVEDGHQGALLHCRGDPGRELVQGQERILSGVGKMSQFTVVCPACRQAMACAEQHRGRNVKCPRCGANVAVPAAGSPAVPSRTPPSPSITARASPGNVPNREKMSPLTLATIIAVGLGALFVLGLVTLILVGGRSPPVQSAKAPDAAPPSRPGTNRVADKKETISHSLPDMKSEAPLPSQRQAATEKKTLPGAEGSRIDYLGDRDAGIGLSDIYLVEKFELGAKAASPPRVFPTGTKMIDLVFEFRGEPGGNFNYKFDALSGAGPLKMLQGPTAFLRSTPPVLLVPIIPESRLFADGPYQMTVTINDKPIAVLNWSVSDKLPGAAIPPSVTPKPPSESRGQSEASGATAIRAQTDTQPLIARLEDKGSWNDRIQAAEELGKLRDPRAIEPLLRCLKGQYDDTKLRFAVAHALAQFGQPVVGPLIDLLATDNAQVRAGAEKALADCGKPAVEPLADYLKQARFPKGCPSAALILGDLGDPRGVEPLTATLHGDPQCSLTWAAIHALGKLGDKRARRTAPRLPQFAAVRSGAIATALAKLGDPQAIEPIADIFAREANSKADAGFLNNNLGVLCTLAESLAKFGKPALPSLLPYLHHKESNVRLAVIMRHR